MFNPVDPRPNFVKIEKRLLDWWYKSGIVKKYLHKNDQSSKQFSFLDGPITANNPMGVHHAWGRTLKDVYQRYHNMKGEKQRFQNGFDCQGLWVEVEVEKELGFADKKDIEKYGIAKFVEKCKERVRKFSKVQTEQSKRLGYFMDWDNSYYTMSEENNYMIWYFLKKCHQKGLVYKGRDSVPWCPRCGTAISQHEILQEEYQELTHDSVYLKFPYSPDEFLLVWTTTPWTIPGNILVAVNPDIVYAQVLYQGEKYWLAKSQVARVFAKDYQILKEVKGKNLGGFYQAPFDDFPAVAKIKKAQPKFFHKIVLSSELVTEAEGTGLVHIAPGCGTEDFRLAAKEMKSPELVLAVVDEAGFYLEGFGEFSGQNAKDHPELIIDYLKKKNQGRFLFKTELYKHRYPVCWRCKTELIWRVVDEWYIKMDPMRKPMMAVTEKIKWLPEWGREQELDWLKNMEDWLISKKRYWGLALPIWECQKCSSFEVIGGYEELKGRAVEGWKDFEGHSPHRPWIDKVKIKCKKCQGLMTRIPDVGNPWLDAGIVTYSTYLDPKTGKVSYMTDKNYWRRWFPPDLVLECFPGQFKNWFYSLIAMSTVLENKPPFQTLLGHALVRDEKGDEMHKSKGNAIDFNDAAEKMGVDVMRWLYVKQNHELNLNFGFRVADQVRRQFHLTLWNVYKFFVTYANLADFKPTIQPFNHSTISNPLDRWISSRLNWLIKEVTSRMDSFDNPKATEAIENFLVNNLSLWYVRRSRDRVDSCLATLYHVLKTFCLLLAPFNPFLAEEIYKNLTGEARLASRKARQESVHLADWPRCDQKAIDKKLEEEMVLVRQICELGHAARKKVEIKVRQPLRVLRVTGHVLPNSLVQLIKDELNVKEVKFVKGERELRAELDTKISPKLKTEGEARELIREIQELRKKTGCQLDEKITVFAPSWPKEFEEQIKRKTLATKIVKGKKLEIKKG